MIQPLPIVQPTPEAYADFQVAFDHFNKELFENALEPCMLTLQRKSVTEGYFSAGRFVNGAAIHAHEISLNPAYFARRSTEQVLVRLVHQMVHYFQTVAGTPGRGGYHNDQWADMMEAVGLIPSTTRLPGGKRTGDSVYEYVEPNGLFEAAYAKLIDTGFAWRWFDTRIVSETPFLNSAVTQAMNDVPGTRLLDQPMSDTKRHELGIHESIQSSRRPSKYVCSRDKVNVWGRRNLVIYCGICKFQLEEILR
jgi:predicted SprT family Zn-dependent metalloprotease